MTRPRDSRTALVWILAILMAWMPALRGGACGLECCTAGSASVEVVAKTPGGSCCSEHVESEPVESEPAESEPAESGPVEDRASCCAAGQIDRSPDRSAGGSPGESRGEQPDDDCSCRVVPDAGVEESPMAFGHALTVPPSTPTATRGFDFPSLSIGPTPIARDTGPPLFVWCCRFLI